MILIEERKMCLFYHDTKGEENDDDQDTPGHTGEVRTGFAEWFRVTKL